MAGQRSTKDRICDIVTPSQRQWRREFDEAQRKRREEEEARRNAILASGEGLIMISVEENLEERLALLVSRVECFPLSFSGGDFTTGAESNLAELRVNATRVELA